jgi:hypothetical protein
MIHLIRCLFSLIASSARTRLSLQLEDTALRHQALNVPGRKLEGAGLLVRQAALVTLVSKWWCGRRKALCFVQPRTVVAWQKQRFRDYWRALSRHGLPGRPKIAPELRQLIKRMWRANPMWGSPRIVSELKMLGIDVAKSTVERHQPRPRKPPSPHWRTFLGQPAHELASNDCFQLIWMTIILGKRIGHSPTMHLTIGLLVSPSRRRSSPSRLFMGSITTTCPRLHEYSGPTGIAG